MGCLRKLLGFVQSLLILIGLFTVIFFLLREPRVVEIIDSWIPDSSDPLPVILREEVCLPKDLPSMQDIGCVTKEEDTVRRGRNNNWQSIYNSQPFQNQDQIEVSTLGKALLEIFDGQAWIRVFGGSKIDCSPNTTGKYLCDMNKMGTATGSLGEGESLSIKINDDYAVEVTEGTQFFIDYNPDTSRAVVGNLHGNLRLNQSSVPEAEFRFTDSSSGISDSHALDITLAEIETFSDGPFLIAVQEMRVRSGPGTEYSQITELGLQEGKAARITNTVSTDGWWQIECPNENSADECWVSGGDEYTIPVNIDNPPINVGQPTQPPNVPPQSTLVSPTAPPILPSFEDPLLGNWEGTTEQGSKISFSIVSGDAPELLSFLPIPAIRDIRNFSSSIESCNPGEIVEFSEPFTTFSGETFTILTPADNVFATGISIEGIFDEASLSVSGEMQVSRHCGVTNVEWSATKQ